MTYFIIKNMICVQLEGKQGEKEKDPNSRKVVCNKCYLMTMCNNYY
jgi:hypothetical protein